MIVRELINLLKNLDPNTLIFLNRSWPPNKPLEDDDLLVRSIHFTDNEEEYGRVRLCTEEDDCPNCRLYGKSQNGLFFSHDFSIGV